VVLVGCGRLGQAAGAAVAVKVGGRRLGQGELVAAVAHARARDAAAGVVGGGRTGPAHEPRLRREPLARAVVGAHALALAGQARLGAGQRTRQHV
jgi:hypothetical protein